MRLGEIATQVISLTQPKWRNEAEAEGVSIVIVSDIEETPPISGVEAELREALTNLVLNACDAMPNGGHIRLHIRVERSTHVGDPDQHAVVEISDTGVGMSPHVQQRCLDPFFTTKDVRGTGMGLSMVYGIVLRHDGHMEIVSEEGKGTTVTLRFHVSDESEDETEDLRGRPHVTGLRVLVVDDDDRVRKILTEYLRRDEHIVETAGDGEEGIEAFRQGHFDLVITDRSMPVMSGDQLAERLREEGGEVPVIMLTGFGALMDVLPDGVEAVVAKPVTLVGLRDTIARAVR